MFRIKPLSRNILFVLAILAFLAAAGWNDWKEEETFIDNNISITLDDGWAGQPENVFIFEIVPTGGLRDEPIAIEYEYGETRYAYAPQRQNINPGLHFANPRQIFEYEDISALKNNTSKDAISMEKIFIDERHERLTYAYAIILGNEVDFLYQTHGYEIQGYESQILGSSDGNLEIRYIPSMASYFFYFILPDWIVFSVLILCASSWIFRSKK